MRKTLWFCCFLLAHTACGPDTDTDEGVCGNGVIDAWEICDPGITAGRGACPTSCSGTDACTEAILTGSAETCDAACTNRPVTRCEDGDGCCPAGCEGEGDTDCGGGCTDECASVGLTQCEQNAVITCGGFDGDSCLEWSAPTACGAGLTCNAGVCEATCVSECATLGETACDGGSAVITCEDVDGQGCLKWSAPEACGATLVCSGGSCVAGCSDECTTVGAVRCATGSTTAYQTCDDHDADECLEWGAPLACPAGRICEDNACQEAPPPPVVLINEVVYDSLDTDTETFVELFGPAGTSLAGYRLVGVNGQDGTEYNEITLAGNIGADGYFVVANPSGAAALLAAADQQDALVDYQNGPDNIVLRFHDTTIDALGYGSFNTQHFFSGEGAPVQEPPVGHSLGRDAQHTDTDNNTADFHDYEVPTPGAVNG